MARVAIFYTNSIVLCTNITLFSFDNLTIILSPPSFKRCWIQESDFQPQDQIKVYKLKISKLGNRNVPRKSPPKVMWAMMEFFLSQLCLSPLAGSPSLSPSLSSLFKFRLLSVSPFNKLHLWVSKLTFHSSISFKDRF